MASDPTLSFDSPTGLPTICPTVDSDCRNCPVCDLAPVADDSLGQVEVNHTNRELLERQTYELTYCQCGELVYLSPLPVAGDIHAMYAASLQFEEREGSPYRGEHAASVLEYMTGRLLGVLRTQGLDTGTAFRMLEIGAGLAWMCRAAKIVSWDNTTVGQDLSDETVDECRWVDHYIVEDVLASRAVEELGPYGVISMTHVFEHLVDPVGMLERVGGLLGEGGIVFITAPSRPEGWQRSDQIDRWIDWSYHHVPAHIQYFNRASFTRAAEAAGFEVILWDGSHEGGQAFEGWLRKPTGEVS